MKALWHPRCSAIVSPPTGGWITCHCRQYAARWRDPDVGMFEVASRDGEREARVLGFHNSYILAGIGDPLTDPSWRSTWAAVRAVTPDSYLFVRRESPLVVIAPGESRDTFWVNWPEELTGT